MAEIEPLSNGLVLSNDPSLLQPGELTVAQDVFLKPTSPSIHKVPGRRRFNTTSTTVSDGIAYCAFANSPDRIVAIGGGNYLIAPAGEGGEFQTLAAGAGGSLTSAQIEDRVALMSGASNIVALSDGTSRPLGLDPILTAPGLTHTASGGTGVFSVLGLGWYEYWTTEVYKTATEEVESTFIGATNQVNVTNNNSTVAVSRPPIVNAGATHWRVYRSQKKVNATDPTGFPLGFLIGTLPISSPFFTDGGATTTGLTLAGSGDNSTNFTIHYTAPASDFVFPGNWVNPGNVTLADGTTATSASVSCTAAGGPYPVVITTYSPMRAGTFGLTVGDPITDINVTVNAKRTGNAGLSIRLTWDGGNTWTKAQTVSLTTGLTVLSVNGLWGRTWSAAELANGIFYVQLLAFGNVAGSSGTVDVDYVKVNVTNSGTSTDISTLFPSTVITAGPALAAIGRNGKPPSATTGDIFQGALVMNDPANPRQVAWTVPGFLDYSPAIYRLAVDEPVTNIASLGYVCLIGQTGKVERLNYLPLEDDAEFNTGRAKEFVDSDDGIVGPHAACKFTMEGQLRLFYVGSSSLRMSNGFESTTATDEITWSAMVAPALLSRCHVINNAFYHEILVFFGEPGSDTVNKVLRLSYDPQHVKDGKLKVSGITNYAANASTVGISDNGIRVVYTARLDGFVYVENRGSTDASGTGIHPIISTREIHNSGLNQAWELISLGVHHQDIGDLTVTYAASEANYPDASVPGGKLIPASDRRLNIVDGGVGGDGITITLTGKDDGRPVTIDYLLLFSEGLGPPNAIKT